MGARFVFEKDEMPKSTPVQRALLRMRWHFIDNETEYANLGRRQLIVTSLLPRQNEEWSGSTSIYAESEAGILPMGLWKQRSYDLRCGINTD